MSAVQKTRNSHAVATVIASTGHNDNRARLIGIVGHKPVGKYAGSPVHQVDR